MTDNKLVTLIVAGFIAALGFTFMGVVIGQQTLPAKTKTQTVYVQHPKGLHRLPQFGENTNLGALTKVCDVWANFTPTATLPFKAGQHYVSECKIIVTPPSG